MKIPLIHPIFEFISSNSLGPIPLDIVAHLLISAVITYALFRKGISPKKIIFTILILAVAKEIYDLPRLSNSPSENVKDILVSMIIPVAFLRNKLQRVQNK